LPIDKEQHILFVSVKVNCLRRSLKYRFSCMLT